MKIFVVFLILTAATVTTYAQSEISYRCEWRNGDYVILHSKNSKSRFLVTPNYVVDLAGELPKTHDYYIRSQIRPMPLQQSANTTFAKNDVPATVIYKDRSKESVTCRQVHFDN